MEAITDFMSYSSNITARIEIMDLENEIFYFIGLERLLS